VTIGLAIEQDREEKKEIVVSIITKKFFSSPRSTDLRVFREAIERKQERLVIEIITGGLTNYSYKISLRSDPSKALYAKITFPHALWHPDKTLPYDTSRTQREFELMQTVMMR